MKNKDKRRPFSGIMLAFLYYSKKAKVLMAIGAILIVIGIAGGLYYGSIVVNETVSGRFNQATQSPYPVNGVDPLFAEKVFIGLAIAGLAVLAWGIATGSRSSKKYRLNQK